MDIVLSVQARMGSTRLPGKVMLPIGNKQVLGHIEKRVHQASQPDGILMTVGDRPENEVLTEWCRRQKCRYVVGPEDNLLVRHLLAASELDADVLVRINADCPFVPTKEIDRVINVHLDSEAQYTTNQTGNVPHGINVDVINVDVLKELRQKGENHPVSPLREDLDDEWEVVFTERSKWSEFTEAELTLDTPEDYWLLRDAVESVGTETKKIAKWVERELSQD